MLPIRLSTRAVPFALAILIAAAPLHAQTTGLVPLTDLGSGTYLGFPGGLYPGGQNTPPAGHLGDALARAAEIVPRSATGAPDPSGWIGMIAVGMSNTTHEFGAFERNADADPSRNPRVVILDTGFGGQTATVIANPSAGYWTTMSQRIAAMGLTAAQVQVAWLKEAESHPPNNFPIHAQAFRDTLKRVVRNLHDKFPNLKICYVSSRIYGGYSAQGTLNPEPQAYEYGFSVKWLIEDQIAGDPALNHGQLGGDVRAPLLLWGPYLWADGTNPRSDGLVWLPSDLENDQVHPSPAGEQKVAGLLADFFASDTTTSWWRAPSTERLIVVDAVEDAYVSAAAPTTNFGAGALLIAQGGADPLSIFTRFDLSAIPYSVLLAKLSLRVAQGGGGSVRRVDDATWDESTITYATAPAIGTTLVAMPQSSRDGTIGANVTEIVRADVDRQLAFALTTTSAQPTSYHSKEASQPPRLVLVTSADPALVGDRTPGRRPLRLAGPNPFAGAARIVFELARAGDVELEVFGIDGRRVRTLARGAWPAGAHVANWDGRDARGHETPPGIHLIRLRASGAIASIKVVRAK